MEKICEILSLCQKRQDLETINIVPVSSKNLQSGPFQKPIETTAPHPNLMWGQASTNTL